MSNKEIRKNLESAKEALLHAEGLLKYPSEFEKGDLSLLLEHIQKVLQRIDECGGSNMDAQEGYFLRIHIVM